MGRKHGADLPEMGAIGISCNLKSKVHFAAREGRPRQRDCKTQYYRETRFFYKDLGQL